MALIISDSRPLDRSTSACGNDLYGTCSMSTPAMLLKSSTDRCDVVPLPTDGNDSSPGLVFANAISCFTLVAGSDGWTTTISGPELTRLTGARSFCGS